MKLKAYVSVRGSDSKKQGSKNLRAKSESSKPKGFTGAVLTTLLGHLCHVLDNECQSISPQHLSSRLSLHLSLRDKPGIIPFYVPSLPFTCVALYQPRYKYAVLASLLES